MQNAANTFTLTYERKRYRYFILFISLVLSYRFESKDKVVDLSLIFFPLKMTPCTFNNYLFNNLFFLILILALYRTIVKQIFIFYFPFLCVIFCDETIKLYMLTITLFVNYYPDFFIRNKILYSTIFILFVSVYMCYSVKEICAKKIIFFFVIKKKVAVIQIILLLMHMWSCSCCEILLFIFNMCLTFIYTVKKCLKK